MSVFCDCCSLFDVFVYSFGVVCCLFVYLFVRCALCLVCACVVVIVGCMFDAVVCLKFRLLCVVGCVLLVVCCVLFAPLLSIDLVFFCCVLYVVRGVLFVVGGNFVVRRVFDAVVCLSFLVTCLLFVCPVLFCVRCGCLLVFGFA